MTLLLFTSTLQLVPRTDQVISMLILIHTDNHTCWSRAARTAGPSVYYAAVEALTPQLHVAPKLLRNDNNRLDIMLCCACHVNAPRVGESIKWVCLNICPINPACHMTPTRVPHANMLYRIRPVPVHLMSFADISTCILPSHVGDVYQTSVTLPQEQITGPLTPLMDLYQLERTYANLTVCRTTVTY